MDIVLRGGIIRSMSDQITQDQIRAIEREARTRVHYLAWLIVRLRMVEDQLGVREAAAAELEALIEAVMD